MLLIKKNFKLKITKVFLLWVILMTYLLYSDFLNKLIFKFLLMFLIQLLRLKNKF